ncbi:hypothetical protein BgiMline_034966 [Biomphalaria glabrata]|nr:hypothetical protein BgiMline_029517 [Biomphalaria glabrata]
MRLAEVARARAEQLIEPCRTLTTVSSENIANLTLEHVSNDVPIDFATLCFIVSCITFVCVVILMVSLMCPPKFPPCLLRKGKQPTRRQQPRIHSMTAHLGSNDHFLTASRTGVQVRLSPVDKVYCSSGSSTTSRSTTTSVSSSSRTVTSRKMTPKSTGSPEGASALIYDKIPDTKNGSKDQNINGSSACTYSENESGDPDAPEFFTILEPPMFENQHSKTSFKNKASYDCTHNECYCKQFLLPLLKQKVCCIEDKPRQSKCCKRKRSLVHELKKAPRNIYEKTPRSHFQKDLLGPDKEAESDSMTLNTTAVNSSRIYRLPSLSQSTIKRAESCGEDMFDHSTQTPSITTDSRTLSRTPGNRDISQCSETFVCSSGPRHAGPFATLNSKPEDITSEMVVSTLSSTANHDTLTSSSYASTKVQSNQTLSHQMNSKYPVYPHSIESSLVEVCTDGNTHQPLFSTKSQPPMSVYQSSSATNQHLPSSLIGTSQNHKVLPSHNNSQASVSMNAPSISTKQHPLQSSLIGEYTSSLNQDKQMFPFNHPATVTANVPTVLAAEHPHQSSFTGVYSNSHNQNVPMLSNNDQQAISVNIFANSASHHSHQGHSTISYAHDQRKLMKNDQPPVSVNPSSLVKHSTFSGTNSKAQTSNSLQLQNHSQHQSALYSSSQNNGAQKLNLGACANDQILYPMQFPGDYTASNEMPTMFCGKPSNQSTVDNPYGYLQHKSDENSKLYGASSGSQQCLSFGNKTNQINRAENEKKALDFFGFQFSSLPSHIRPRQRYDNEPDALSNVPRRISAEATEQVSQTQRSHCETLMHRNSDSQLVIRKDGKLSHGGGNCDEAKKYQEHYMYCPPCPPRRCSHALDFEDDLRTPLTEKLVPQKCGLRPELPQIETHGRTNASGRESSRSLVGYTHNDTPMPTQSPEDSDEEYVDMSQSSRNGFTVSYHKSDHRPSNARY